MPLPISHWLDYFFQFTMNKPLCTHLPRFSGYQSRASRGSALLMVLWVVGFLTLLVTTAMLVLRQDIETSASQQMVFRTRQLAEMGIALAVHPMVKPNDPLLHGKLSSIESFDAVMTTEEGRLSLKSLLTEERREVLERLFRRWGLNPLDAQSVVDAMMDWVDEDELMRLKGAERRDYLELGLEDRPYNREFRSLDEVSQVLGMELVEQVYPNWRDEFTVFGQGQLDVNEATALRISVVANVDLSRAEDLVEQRNGPDGKLHTEDDARLEHVDEAMSALGLSGQAGEQVAPLLTLQGSTRRVESLGRMGDHERGIAVVMQGGGGGGLRILEWKEFVP